jgi:hypothetical protein
MSNRGSHAHIDHIPPHCSHYFCFRPLSEKWPLEGQDDMSNRGSHAHIDHIRPHCSHYFYSRPLSEKWPLEGQDDMSNKGCHAQINHITHITSHIPPHWSHSITLPTLLHDVLHGYTIVTFFVGAFAAPDHQHLWGLMMYLQVLGYFVGDISVAYQVQIVEVYAFRLLLPLQPLFGHCAYGAARAVFEDDNRMPGALLFYLL